MERLARKKGWPCRRIVLEILGCDHPPPSIFSIAEDGCSKMLHVDTDLMGPSRLDPTLDERDPPPLLQHPIAGETRSPSQRKKAHLLSMVWIASDPPFDDPFRGRGDTVGQGEVDLFHPSSGKLLGEIPVDRIALCNDETTGGIAIEAMDNSRSENPADPREVFTMIEKGVDEGPFFMAGRGVDNESGLFMDEKEMLIFIENRKRNRLRFRREFDRFGEEDDNPLPPFQAIGGLRLPRLDGDEMVFDQAL